MEVSKVTFTEQTRAQLQDPFLHRTKRTQLRRQLIIDYIRSKPAGTPITSQEIAEASGDLSWRSGKRTANITTFLQRMERDGLITIEKIPHSWKAIYNVVGDAKTVSVLAPTPTGNLIEQVIALAKDFAWESNSDSLHEFVDWLRRRKG